MAYFFGPPCIVHRHFTKQAYIKICSTEPPEQKGPISFRTLCKLDKDRYTIPDEVWLAAKSYRTPIYAEEHTHERSGKMFPAIL